MIKVVSKQLAKAINIAAENFKDKYDKSGEPYILHCLKVMEGVKHLGEQTMLCAVLHDILEDCPTITESYLLAEDFTYGQVATIKMLTHDDNDTYDEYIKKISTDKIATAIKLVDLRHNSDITRLKGVTKRDFNRMEKYHRAFTYLKEC